MAGRVAKGGGLSIDTPVARIRGSRGGGIASLTLAALTFAVLKEVRADDHPVIDDDELELPHGTFVLETKEKVPRIIAVDDPWKTVVLRKVGSTVEVDQVTNSSDRMDELEKASRDTFAIYRLGQQEPFIQHHQRADLGSSETRSDFSKVSIASLASSSTPDLNPSSFVPLSIVPVAINSTALPDYQPPILVPVLAPVQVPHISGVTLVIDSGSSSSDHITNIGTLVVSGVAAGATPQYSIDGGATWTGSFTPVEGANTVLVRQIDSAGNVSVATSFSFILDTVAPGAPTIVSVTENPVINASEASNGTPVLVNLTRTGAMAGDILTIHWGGQTMTYTLLASDITVGSATVMVSAATIAAQGDGTINVTAQLTDAAGNVSASSTYALPVDVDTLAPTVVISDDEPGTANIAGGDITYTFQFSETVTGFDTSDVTVANGTKGTFTAVDGDTYTLVVTPNANFQGSLTVAVSAGAGFDTANNPSTAAAPSVQAADTLAPTVVISDDEPGTANIAGGDITYTFQFSETVTGFDTSDVTVANGTKGTFTAVDADTYTLVVTPNANFQGSLTVAVSAGAGFDTANNPSTAAAPSVQAVDTLAPTVVISDDEPGTANIAGGDITYTFQFSETVTGFDTSDVTVANGTKGTFTAVDGDTYTLVVTPNANFQGSLTVAVSAGAGFDTANNPSTAAAPSVQAADTLAPTVVISDDEPGTANIAGGDITYTFQFSETVTGFDTSDVTVANGTKGTFTAVDGDTYTLVVTPNANFQGSLTVAVSAGAGFDTANNPSTAAAPSVQAADTLAPTVVISDDEPGTANIAGGDITYTFQFSETVTGFDTSDVTVANGTKGTFTAVDADTYTLVVTPNANFQGSLTVAVSAGAGFDTANNPSTAAAPSVQAADTLAPTVVISDDEPGTANIAGGDITYTFQFSETVTGFDTSDVTVANGTKGTFTAVDADTYTLVVTPNANFQGSLTVAVSAGAGFDTANNPSTAAAPSVQAVDTLAPTVVISDDEPGTANIAGGDITYTFQFSETVTGFDTSDVTVANGTKGTFTAVDADTYTLVVTPNANFQGSLTVAVSAGAGFDTANNPSTAAAPSVQAADTLAPTVVISDDEPGTANIAGGDITYTFQFSETVTGFDTSDVTVANGTKGTFTAVDGDTYTLVVTPNANFQGSLTVAVSAGAGFDTANNPSTAAAPSVQAADTLAPTVVISDDEPGTANIAGGDITYTFQFSETVTGFDTSDVTVANGTKGTFTAVDGDTYTLVVTPNANFQGSLTVAVSAGAGFDTANNPSTAAAPSVQAVDTLAPTVVISDDEPGTANIAGGDITYTFQFSETVTGFDTSDVTVANGTKGTFTAVDGDTYTLVVTPNANFQGSLTVAVSAGAGFDTANNPSTAAAPSVQAADTLAPTVVISDDEPGTANIAGGDITYTFQFSETVTGFDTSDVTVANGTKGTFTAVDGDTYTLVVTPNANFQGSLTVAVSAGAGFDTANNPSTAAAPSVQAADTLAPTVVISDDEPGTANIAGGDITYTFQFSETVTGFDTSDVTVANGTKGTFTAVDADTYTLVVTPNANFQGSLTVAVSAGAGFDTANNPSTAAAPSVQAVDTLAPTVVISDDEPGTANIAGGDITYTFQFSETVTGFDTSDVTVANGTKGTFTAVDGDTYTLVVTPNANFQGSLTVAVSAGAGFDTANNPSTAAAPSVQAADTLAPTVVISDDEPGTANIAGGDITYTFQFSETVTGFDTSDVTVANGTKGTFTAVDGDTYTLVVTPNANFQGSLTVAVSAGAGFDTANNPSTAAAPSVQAVDTLAPTATIVVADTVLQAGETSLVTITSSEAVTGLTTGDLTVENGTLTNLSSSDGGITWTATLTPTANIEDPTNVIKLNNTGVQDAAGNTGVGTTTSNNYAVDTVVADPNDFDDLAPGPRTTVGIYVYGSPNGEEITGGGNNGQIIYAGAGNDGPVNGTGLNDIIYGGSGNDTINGNNGDDIIFGGSGTDTISGTNGNDVFIGGFGADQLSGNNENDIFVYLSVMDFTGANSTQSADLVQATKSI